MRKRVAAFLILSFAGLLWTGHPLLAQEGSGQSDRALTSKWEQANALFLKGKDYFAKKELDGAEAELKASLEILPEHADALFYLAQIEYLKGNFDWALADIQEAEAAYAATAGAQGSISAERRKALLDERARKEREIAIMEATFYEAGCSTENELLKLPESIEALRREIASINARLDEQTGPGSPPLPADYSYVHGNIFFKMNDLQGASGQYLKAIEADASHLGAYNNLINLCYTAKEYEEALKFIDRAEKNGVKLNPKLKEAVLQLAKK